LKLYDAHNHFQDEWLAQHRERILPQLNSIGLQCAVVNGTTEGDWPLVSRLAQEHDWMLPSYGLHPWHCGARSPDWLATLRTHLEANPKAPVGEIGVDRWILERARTNDPRRTGASPGTFEEQVEVFVAQLRLAAELNRAVTIHCLDAFGKLLEILQTTKLPARGILLHAYGGPAEMVKQFADLGAYFSFNGSFLAPRAAAKRDAFKLVPAAQLLVETDAPAMQLPEELRHYPLPDTENGIAVNNPAEIETVYAGLAELRGVALATLGLEIESNFKRLFLN
jgi:TatD DNase family protein